MFPRQPFNITVIQVCAPISNAEEAKGERFNEDLQDLLELTPPKDVLFIIGGWNGKVRSLQILGVTGKFGLGVQNEAGERLTEFCQENALVIANTNNTREDSTNGHHRNRHTNGQYQNQIDYILSSQTWRSLYSQQKQDCFSDHELPYYQIQI